jgi:hypothetical protein
VSGHWARCRHNLECWHRHKNKFGRQPVKVRSLDSTETDETAAAFPNFPDRTTKSQAVVTLKLKQEGTESGRSKLCSQKVTSLLRLTRITVVERVA